MAETVVRPAQAEDAPRLAEIVEAAYGPYVEPIGGRPRPMDDDYAELVRSRAISVAERGGQVVGLIALEEGDGALEIDNLAVAPDAQGTGAGRALLEHAESEARRRGLDTLSLFTHEKMADSLALYERIGYIEYERRQITGGSLVFLRKRLPRR